MKRLFFLKNAVCFWTNEQNKLCVACFVFVAASVANYMFSADVLTSRPGRRGIGAQLGLPLRVEQRYLGRTDLLDSASAEKAICLTEGPEVGVVGSLVNFRLSGHVTRHVTPSASGADCAGATLPSNNGRSFFFSPDVKQKDVRDSRPNVRGSDKTFGAGNVDSVLRQKRLFSNGKWQGPFGVSSHPRQVCLISVSPWMHIAWHPSAS